MHGIPAVGAYGTLGKMERERKEKIRSGELKEKSKGGNIKSEVKVRSVTHKQAPKEPPQIKRSSINMQSIPSMAEEYVDIKCRLCDWTLPQRWTSEPSYNTSGLANHYKERGKTDPEHQAMYEKLRAWITEQDYSYITAAQKG